MTTTVVCVRPILNLDRVRCSHRRQWSSPFPLFVFHNGCFVPNFQFRHMTNCLVPVVLMKDDLEKPSRNRDSHNALVQLRSMSVWHGAP